ncbi:MAG: hypothetical protein ACSHYB_14320 [Roseibacillus sp.]
MEFSRHLYSFFNLAEGCLWIATAFYLIAFRERFKPEKRFWVLLAAPAFVTFAVSDFLEAPRYAADLPTWLWVTKIIAGFIIFLCRVVYLGSNQKRAVTETVVFGLLLLSVALYLMRLF